MTSIHRGGFARHWKEIASGFLKLAVTSYGGPAIMGIMLVLTMTYAHFGATPIMRGGLYGLGPVVLGIFMVAATAIFLPSFILRTLAGEVCT